MRARHLAAALAAAVALGCGEREPDPVAAPPAAEPGAGATQPAAPTAPAPTAAPTPTPAAQATAPTPASPAPSSRRSSPASAEGEGGAPPTAAKPSTSTPTSTPASTPASNPTAAPNPTSTSTPTPAPPSAAPPSSAEAHAKVGPDKCKLCHRVQHQSWSASPHAAKGLDCEACHGSGGDYWPASVMRDRAKALAAGLVLPDVSTCRRCHPSATSAMFLRVHAHKAR